MENYNIPNGLRSKSIIFLATIQVVLLVCIGFWREGLFLVKESRIVHADAVIILMGSIEDRVLQAADIYHTVSPSKVFMVETRNPRVQNLLFKRGVNLLSNTQQSRNALISLGIPSDSIQVLPGGATSTLMEAIATRKELAQRSDIDTLIIVSSSEHMRRSSMIFKTAFRQVDLDIEVLCSPSKYSKFDPKQWWHTRDGIETVFMEYLKIANFLVIDRWKL